MPSSATPSTGAAASSSRPARAPGRRPSSSSACCAGSATAHRSTACLRSRSPTGRPPSSAAASARASSWPARWSRRGPSTRPGSRRSTGSACASCAPTRSRPASTRASRSPTTSVPACSSTRRSTWRSSGSSRRAPTGAFDLLATYGRRRLRPMMLDALARLRSAGRPLDLRPAERRDLAPAQIAARAAATALAGAEKPDALTALLDTGPAAAELTDLSAQRLRKAAANQDYNDALAELEQAARDEVASADLAELERLLCAPRRCLPRPEGRPQPGRLRRPRAAGPRPPVRAAGPGRGLSGAVRRRARRRVPGHEPASVRADRPRGGRRALLRRRRVPEHLPVPPRRRLGVPPAAGGGGPGADRASPQLPLAAARDRRRERGVLARFRRPLHAARRRGAARGRSSGRRAGRALAHRQGGLPGGRGELAGGRGPRAGRADRRAGRRGRGAARPDRPAVRGRHGRGPVRGGAPRPPPADGADDRPRLLRDPAGVRPARLPAPPAQPLRRRRAPHRPCLPARRHVERRPPARPAGGGEAADLHGVRARRARAGPVHG